MKSILVTGAAGFIGANLVMRLLREMTEGSIVGLDNLNSYYDVSLKEYRLKLIEEQCNCQSSTVSYQFVKGNIADKALVDGLFAKYRFDIVVNLAAQAGVRYSIENPDAYIQSNIIGFYNILEACRHAKELVEEHEKKTVNCQLPICLSTDKAAYPINAMGITKAIEEKIAAAKSRLSGRTKICCTRYGNVMCSRGSVIPALD